MEIEIKILEENWELFFSFVSCITPWAFQLVNPQLSISLESLKCTSIPSSCPSKWVQGKFNKSKSSILSSRQVFGIQVQPLEYKPNNSSTSHVYLVPIVNEANSSWLITTQFSPSSVYESMSINPSQGCWFQVKFNTSKSKSRPRSSGVQVMFI